MKPPLPRRRLLQAGAAAALGLPAWLAGCSSAPVGAVPKALPAAPPPPVAPLPTGDEPPPEPREFRAAWVATVANIDWPSRPGLSAAEMQREAIAILDRAVALQLNALILQVRPACDAIFPSALEPWSEFLSGTQGQPPWQPGEAPWDPLAFWVQEAHRRAIELHAWFNPYRARHSAAKSALTDTHIARTRPHLVQRYGEQLWMDPGQPEAAAHTLAVVEDVLRRYAIDAVHIDDYFYPYPVAVDGVNQPFPDDGAWTRYKLEGGPIASRDDWRRAQVDTLVQALHRTVQTVRPGTRFGISPFGLPRPDRRPPGIVGFSQFDQLYADVEKWFENGWCDYLAPQLYWPIDRVGQRFDVLLDHWLAHNPAQRHVWAGLFTSRITRGEPLGTNSWPGQELLDQIALQRGRAAAQPPDRVTGAGHIHFSMVALLQDRDGIASRLQAGPYATPALVPATPWVADTPAPAVRLQAQGTRVLLAPASGQAPQHWAVWLRRGGVWRLQRLSGSTTVLDATGADRVVASALSRSGQAGLRGLLKLAG